jgi:hypothetical protein
LGAARAIFSGAAALAGAAGGFAVAAVFTGAAGFFAAVTSFFGSAFLVASFVAGCAGTGFLATLLLGVGVAGCAGLTAGLSGVGDTLWASVAGAGVKASSSAARHPPSKPRDSTRLNPALRRPNLGSGNVMAVSAPPNLRRIAIPLAPNIHNSSLQGREILATIQPREGLRLQKKAADYRTRENLLSFMNS